MTGRPTYNSRVTLPPSHSARRDPGLRRHSALVVLPGRPRVAGRTQAYLAVHPASFRGSSVVDFEIDSHVDSVVSTLRALVARPQREHFVASRGRARLVYVRELTGASTSVARAGGEQVEDGRHYAGVLAAGVGTREAYIEILATAVFCGLPMPSVALVRLTACPSGDCAGSTSRPISSPCGT